MDPALPWYKSPVYVGIVTSIVSQALAFAGRADLFAVEEINSFVAGTFQFIALAALAVSEIKRRKSNVQPLTLTKAGAEAKAAQTGQPIQFSNTEGLKVEDNVFKEQK